MVVSEASEALVGLIQRALEHGLGAISDGSGPLVPFVLTETEASGATLTRYAEEEYARGLERARAAVGEAAANVARYALGFDAYYTLDGERLDAIFVEAGERDGGLGVAYAQCYRPARPPDEPLARIGGLRLVGAVVNQLEVERPRELVVLVVCPRCGRQNRTSVRRLQTQLARCGACKEPLAFSP